MTGADCGSQFWTLVEGRVGEVVGVEVEIAWAHDLAVHDLFESMRGPAGDAGGCEKWGEEVGLNAHHFVDEAGVEVDVRADVEIWAFALAQDLFGHAGDAVEQIVLGFEAGFLGEGCGFVLEKFGAGIAQGVDGVAHAVDEAGAVEGFTGEDLAQIIGNFAVIVPVLHVSLDVFDHGVGALVGGAVAWPFEGADGGGDGGVGVGAGRRNDVGGESGVVTAAVVGLEDQAEIENFCFERGEFAVFANEMQNIFCGAAAGEGLMHDQALVVEIMLFGGIGVSDHERHFGDEVETLREDVAELDVVGIFVVGIKGEHDALQLVHEVSAWNAQEDVFLEIIREGAAALQGAAEPVELLAVWQGTKEQEVDDFFKTEAVFAFEAADEVGDRNAAVHELAFAWNFLAVFDGVAAYIGDAGDADEDAGAVGVTQSAFDVILRIQFRCDGIVFFKIVDLAGDGGAQLVDLEKWFVVHG